MWKKIFCTFFLLFGLFALFSCASAITTDYSIDWVDFKTICWNVYSGMNTSRLDFRDNFNQAFENHKSDLEFIVDLYNSNRACLYAITENNWNNHLVITYTTNETFMYVYNNALQSSSVYSYKIDFSGFDSNPIINISSRYNGANQGLTMLQWGYFYTNSNIYTNSSRNVIFTANNYSYGAGANSEMLDHQFERSIFNWTTNSNLQVLNISGFGTAVPYLQWSSSSILLGTINQYSNLNIGRSWVDRYVYRNGNWEFLDQRSISHWGRIDISSDIGSIYLESNIYNISGAIYVLHLEPIDTSQFNDWNIPFYNASSKGL